MTKTKTKTTTTDRFVIERGQEYRDHKGQRRRLTKIKRADA